MLALLVLLSKLGLYMAALFGIGLLVHTAAAISNASRWLTALAGLLLLAIVVRLALLNAQLGGGLAEAFSSNTFGWIWSANRMQAVAFLVGAALMAASTMRPFSVLRLPAALVIASGFGLAGHTQGLDAPGLAPFLSALHAFIAGVWIVAPFTLWPIRGEDTRKVYARTERFSSLALWCVPFLFVSGVWLALRLSGPPSVILTTPYGQLLLIKLLLASLALGIGAWNKLRVTRLLMTEPDKGIRSLKQTLGVDIGLFAGVLIAIAAATTLTGPDGG